MKLAGRGGAFEPKVPSPLPEGHVLAGKYRMGKVIGAGGMGVVVSATHIHIGQRVAIKFLLPHALCDEQTVERFAREARALARIESEHVGRVIDVGELDSGQPYTVLECLTGRNLAELMDARGALDIDEAVGYILEACQAMAEAHALGIIHRDLKPENLFLADRADGSRIIKVIDFGVSKISAESAAPRIGGRVTSTSAVVGSPLYMSPEQLRAARDVDARTDIWALGVTLYEMLTGQGPFRWQTLPELCAAILKDAPRPLRELRSGVPEGLEAVVMRCLEKDPARRPPSAAALAVELRPFASSAAAPGGRSTSSPAAISVRRTLLASTLDPSPGPGTTALPAGTARFQADASVTASFSAAPLPAPVELASIEPAPLSEPRVEGPMRHSTLTPPVGLAAVTSVRPFKLGHLGAIKVGLTALVAAGVGISVILAASTARTPVSSASTSASDGVALAQAPPASAVSALPSPGGSASPTEDAKPSAPASSTSALATSAPAPPPPEGKPDQATLPGAPRPPRPGGGRPSRPNHPLSAFDHRK